MKIFTPAGHRAIIVMLLLCVGGAVAVRSLTDVATSTSGIDDFDNDSGGGETNVRPTGDVTGPTGDVIGATGDGTDATGDGTDAAGTDVLAPIGGELPAGEDSIDIVKQPTQPGRPVGQQPSDTGYSDLAVVVPESPNPPTRSPVLETSKPSRWGRFKRWISRGKKSVTSGLGGIKDIFKSDIRQRVLKLMALWKQIRFPASPEPSLTTLLDTLVPLVVGKTPEEMKRNPNRILRLSRIFLNALKKKYPRDDKTVELKVSLLTAGTLITRAAARWSAESKPTYPMSDEILTDVSLCHDALRTYNSTVQNMGFPVSRDDGKQRNAYYKNLRDREEVFVDSVLQRVPRSSAKLQLFLAAKLLTPFVYHRAIGITTDLWNLYKARSQKFQSFADEQPKPNEPYSLPANALLSPAIRTLGPKKDYLYNGQPPYFALEMVSKGIEQFISELEMNSEVINFVGFRRARNFLTSLAGTWWILFAIHSSVSIEILNNIKVNQIGCFATHTYDPTFTYEVYVENVKIFAARVQSVYHKLTVQNGGVGWTFKSEQFFKSILVPEQLWKGGRSCALGTYPDFFLQYESKYI